MRSAWHVLAALSIFISTSIVKAGISQYTTSNLQITCSDDNRLSEVGLELFIPDHRFWREKVRVIKVLPNTPAYRAGLQVGDFVTMANGVSDQDEILEAIKFPEFGPIVYLSVQRGDKNYLEMRLKQPQTSGKCPKLMG